LVNLVPALLGVPLRTFFIATFLGIIPGSFVYAVVGSGINELIELEERPNLSMIFEPKIMGALVGLALLSLIPVIYKKYKSKSNQDLAQGQSGDGARN
ncbi:MAG: TVP38/TMEM64 family protein, partial [Rhodospirillales bacterium]|nr:TVP38/TMEM64 family protein [Rhodospirillales bacterium]